MRDDVYDDGPMALLLDHAVIVIGVRFRVSRRSRSRQTRNKNQNKILFLFCNTFTHLDVVHSLIRHVHLSFHKLTCI